MSRSADRAAPASFLARAPAKVNLGLEVRGRRPDGYHEIRTVLATLDLWDTLVFEPALRGRRLECAEPGVPTDETNLILRAASLLDEATSGGLPGFTIRLEKRIPTGRGLGGGSSDAAAALAGLNRWRGLGLGRPALHRLASRIGMDVPFFLYGGFALAVGRGAQVFPLEAVPELPLVLLIPDFAVATSDAYRGLSATALAAADGQLRGIGKISRSIGPVSNRRRPALESFADRFSNDLEASAVLREIGPADGIPEMRRALMASGAVHAAMTGSGSAVFGVFAEREAAARAALSLVSDGFRAIATRTISRGEHRARRFRSPPDGAWPRG